MLNIIGTMVFSANCEVRGVFLIAFFFFFVLSSNLDSFVADGMGYLHERAAYSDENKIFKEDDEKAISPFKL